MSKPISAETKAIVLQSAIYQIQTLISTLSNIGYQTGDAVYDSLLAAKRDLTMDARDQNELSSR